MKIAVFGSDASAECDGIRRNAREIGREIARRGHTLVTGACGGYPYDAVVGAYKAGGRCIGFSPTTDEKSHRELGMPVDGFSKIIYITDVFEFKPQYVEMLKIDETVCRKYRNVSSAAFSDAAVIIGGRTGTMNEFTDVYDFGRNIGILEDSGGITYRAIKTLLVDTGKASRSKIVTDRDPIKLLDKLLDDGVEGIIF